MLSATIACGHENLSCGPPFSGGRGLRRWTLRTLAYTAVLMAWGEGTALTARFESALSLIDALFPSRRRVGRTYQGFVAALKRRSPQLLCRIESHFRAQVPITAGACWETFGWVVMGADGSRVEAPRTVANEKALGRGGRHKTGPQLWLTTILHLSTSLPWCWKIGKADADERGHLRAMIPLLPLNTLLVADAGYTGYELWKELIDRGRSILIRVGANVRLLRKLGYEVREFDGMVYLWPDKQRRKGHKPLVLRLIRLHDGRKEMCLVTNVLDGAKLSDTQAASIYRMRWGVELWFRAMKQTMQRRRLRSAAPVQAALELRWSVVGLSLLGLMGVRAITQRGGDPRSLGFAPALHAVRAVMRQPHRRGRLGDTLQRRLGRAVKDAYPRRSGKAARSWPHKKTERPPGCPKIRDANPLEIHAAQELRAFERAA